MEQPADQTTLTRRYTEEAIRFMRQARGERPFFIYLAHTFPHVPLFASDAFQGKSRRGIYGDTVEELDWSVGEILRELRALGIAENTFVFFGLEALAALPSSAASVFASPASSSSAAGFASASGCTSPSGCASA